jgi:hypothetical protein
MTLDGIYGMFKQEGRSLTFATRARRSEADGEADLAASGATAGGLSFGFRPPPNRE